MRIVQTEKVLHAAKYLTEDKFDALTEVENKELKAYVDLSLKGKED